jgi:hypothetical protein
MQDQHFQIAMREKPGEPAIPAAAVAAFAGIVLVMGRAGEAALAAVIMVVGFVFVVFQVMSSPMFRHNLDISKYSLSQGGGKQRFFEKKRAKNFWLI